MERCYLYHFDSGVSARVMNKNISFNMLLIHIIYVFYKLMFVIYEWERSYYNFTDVAVVYQLMWYEISHIYEKLLLFVKIQQIWHGRYKII